MLPQLRAALGPLQSQLAHGRRHLVPDQVLAVVRVRQSRYLPAHRAAGNNWILGFRDSSALHSGPCSVSLPMDGATLCQTRSSPLYGCASDAISLRTGQQENYWILGLRDSSVLHSGPCIISLPMDGANL